MLPKLGSMNPVESLEEAPVSSKEEEGILCVCAESLGGLSNVVLSVAEDVKESYITPRSKRSTGCRGDHHHHTSYSLPASDKVGSREFEESINTQLGQQLYSLPAKYKKTPLHHTSGNLIN